MRSRGSSIARGTGKRAGAKRLPPASSPPWRRLIGSVMRSAIGRGAVPLVVAADAADDRGDEHVVEAALGRLGGAAQVVERDVERVEPAAEPAVDA